jgi:hypothetical protein
MDVIDVYGIFVFPPFTKKRIYGPMPVSYLWESPEKSKHNKKAHIVGAVIVILFSLMIILKIY